MRCFLPFGLLLILMNLTFTFKIKAQTKNLAELKQKLRVLERRSNHVINTADINAVNKVAFLYADQYPDSALEILKNIPAQSGELAYYRGETESYTILGNAHQTKGNYDDAKEIADDLKQNLEKINHHGKRAGDIVKGMLQHSRNSSAASKELTDINKLADEYLRLAYHGLRAKDKSFNAILKTDFDETIGNSNIIPQDIGRVILNLITNAFYAVNEKTLSAVATLPTGQADPTAIKYEPTFLISTKKINDKVEIKVTDNGNGIPQKILDKIFQPFFTTKPTGQGTGLGLSMSYDIVKAHGGELKVETKEGEGSEFIISLPV